MTNLDGMIDELESSINEDTGKHVIRQLFDKVGKKDIPLKTEISDNEIKLISRMKVIASEFDIDVLNEICDEFMKLRVSLMRKGRTELCDMGKQIGDNKFGTRNWGMFGNMPQVPGKL